MAWSPRLENKKLRTCFQVRRNSFCSNNFAVVVISKRNTVLCHTSATSIVGKDGAVKAGQAVIGVILEAAIGCRGYVARCVVAERLRRNHGIITQLLHRSRSDSVQAIISITHFGGICKMKTPPLKTRTEKITCIFLICAIYINFYSCIFACKFDNYLFIRNVLQHKRLISIHVNRAIIFSVD